MLNLLYSQNRLSVAEIKRSVDGRWVFACPDHRAERMASIMFSRVSRWLKSDTAPTICEFQ